MMHLSKNDWPQFSAQLLTVAGLIVTFGVQVFHWELDQTQAQAILALIGGALVLIGMILYGATTTANTKIEAIRQDAYARGKRNLALNGPESLEM